MTNIVNPIVSKSVRRASKHQRTKTVASIPPKSVTAETLEITAAEVVTQPKRDTKRARLVAMLETPEGASVAEISDEFGWLHHTTRAALTGLRKSGHRIERAAHAEHGSVYTIVREG